MATEESQLPGRTIDRIRRPEARDVRQVWASESRDFTPWLATNLAYLDVLELGPLTLIDTEVALPNTFRALDLLVQTADERRIAIENQFDAADHDHLTRGLAYAVGLGASALVVIAESFRPEFTAAAAYLNRAAEALGLEEGGIGVFLLELSVDAIEGWYLPRFAVVERPNSWLSDARSDGPKRLGSITEFLALVPEHRRDVLRRIIDDWGARPRAVVSHNASTAVALRLPKPGSRGTVAAVTLHASGGAWINRGYLIDAFAAVGGTPEQVDQALHAWPSARLGEKGYYAWTDTPRFEEYQAFAEALFELFAVPSDEASLPSA